MNFYCIATNGEATTLFQPEKVIAIEAFEKDGKKCAKVFIQGGGYFETTLCDGKTILDFGNDIIKSAEEELIRQQKNMAISMTNQLNKIGKPKKKRFLFF